MNRNRAFVLVTLLFAILAGIEIVAVLMAVALPSTSQFLLTAAEQADRERIVALASILSGPVMSGMLLSLMIAAALAMLYLLLLVIDPHLRNGLRAWRARPGIKLLAVLCSVLGWAALMGSVFGSSLSGSLGRSALLQLAVMIAGTAALWFVGGELGWAGRYDIPGMPDDADPRAALTLGAAAGAAVFAHLRLIEAVMGKYFILVSEVWDRSGETSYRGYVQLAGGLIVLLAVVLPILAGILSALAPVRGRARLGQRLRLPIGVFLMLVVVLAVAYLYAGSKYDLDKQNLADILNIPDHASDSRTVVLFLPSNGLPVTVQEWPLQVSGSGLAAQSTIALSEENLKKVESYLDAHRDGSVFTYTAQDILVKGYHALWDAQRGLAWQEKAAGSQLIHRMVLLARLRHLPVTGENRALLDSLAGPSWHVGGRAALLLARSYRHFGSAADSERWRAKAAEQGVEAPNYDPVTGPMVAGASIRGRLLVNGSAPPGSRIALLALLPQKENPGTLTLTELSLSRLLVDAQELAGDGRFTFGHLGAGQYIVALMVDGSIVPAAVTEDQIRMRRAQGPVAVNSESVRDVGVLDLSVSSQAPGGRK
jgi:hypothetical protein